jgi:hypothetical protein
MDEAPFESPQVTVDARVLLLAEAGVAAMDLGGQCHRDLLPGGIPSQ